MGEDNDEMPDGLHYPLDLCIHLYAFWASSTVRYVIVRGVEFD